MIIVYAWVSLVVSFFAVSVFGPVMGAWAYLLAPTVSSAAVGIVAVVIWGLNERRNWNEWHRKD